MTGIGGETCGIKREQLLAALIYFRPERFVRVTQRRRGAER
jgi:hypothetical protein